MAWTRTYTADGSPTYWQNTDTGAVSWEDPQPTAANANTTPAFDFVKGVDLWDEPAFGQKLGSFKVQADSPLWKPEYANLIYGLPQGTTIDASGIDQLGRYSGLGVGNGTGWFGNAPTLSSYMNSLQPGVSTPLFSQMRKLYSPTGEEGGYFLPGSLLETERYGGGDEFGYYTPSAESGIPANIGELLSKNAYVADIAGRRGYVFPTWQNYLNSLGAIPSVGAEGTGGLGVTQQHTSVTRDDGLFGGGFLGDIFGSIGEFVNDLGPIGQIALTAINPMAAAVGNAVGKVATGQDLGFGDLARFAMPTIMENVGGLLGGSPGVVEFGEGTEGAFADWLDAGGNVIGEGAISTPVIDYGAGITDLLTSPSTGGSMDFTDLWQYPTETDFTDLWQYPPPEVKLDPAALAAQDYADFGVSGMERLGQSLGYPNTDWSPLSNQSQIADYLMGTLGMGVNEALSTAATLTGVGGTLAKAGSKLGDKLKDKLGIGDKASGSGSGRQRDWLDILLGGAMGGLTEYSRQQAKRSDPFYASRVSGNWGVPGARNPFTGTRGQPVTPRQSGVQRGRQFASGGLAAYVKGGTAGQDDKIPALLSDGEYVMDADIVSALGDGNNEAGARKLDEMRENIRRHKRSAPASKIPPKAKSPEQYMKGKK